MSNTSSQQRLGWLSELRAKPTLLLVAGPGWVSASGEREARWQLRDLLAGTTGYAVRVSALLALRCGKQLQYVLVRGCAQPDRENNKWQFPATYCLPGEMPLRAVRRALEANVLAHGDFPGWGEARLDAQGPAFTYVSDCTAVEGHGRFFLNRRVLEFFYPVMLQVASWDALHLASVRPAGWRQGPGVRLLPRQDILALVGSGVLSEATERLCSITDPNATPVTVAAEPQGIATDYLSLWGGESLLAGR